MATRRALRILLFPWFIFYVAGIPARAVRDRFGARHRWTVPLSWALETGMYSVVALPASLLLVIELLISVNEYGLGEQASYRIESDFASGRAQVELVVPGPAYELPPPLSMAAASRPTNRELVERYAPVIIQQVLAHPAYDIPVFIDFDGNADPRDNVDHVSDDPLLAGVYGELTAETADSYYLTYSLYHAKDYDHPIRERVFPGTHHDSDNEGFHVRVDKATLEVVEAETWFHNRFLLCNRTGHSRGTEPVHGKLHVEAATHIVVFAQAQGHGVRCAQTSDLQRLHRNAKILRFRGDGPPVPVRPDRSLQVDATYDLNDFSDWYRRAVRPGTHEPPLFADTLRVGTWPDGRPIEIGRFIASREYEVGTWMRPKPMWSWDDGWDDIPALVWHFFPSHAFESHGGTRLSHAYLHNQPVEQVFGTTADVLWPLLQMDAERRPGDKWQTLEERGDQGTRAIYWRLITRVAKDYVNYVFGALG